MTLAEIAKFLGGDLHGPGELEITRPAVAGQSAPGGIGFAAGPKYLAALESSGIAAVLLPREMTTSTPFIHVDEPKLAFNQLLQRWSSQMPLNEGVHALAAVDATARVNATARIGAFAVVESNASVGAGARIYPFAYVGENCEVGNDAVIHPHAVLLQSVRVGVGSVISAGCVLGADGFRYDLVAGKQVKTPHIGGVEIGSDCEIGALTAIDRATCDATKVGNGTKVDNLTQIAHNVSIGEHCAIAAQTGIAGSAKIGDRVIMGGRSGAADHTSVASDTRFGAGTVALQDITESGDYLGEPARPIAQAKRSMIRATQLADLFERLRRLEQRVQELEG